MGHLGFGPDTLHGKVEVMGGQVRVVLMRGDSSQHLVSKITTFINFKSSLYYQFGLLVVFFPLHHKDTPMYMKTYLSGVFF